MTERRLGIPIPDFVVDKFEHVRNEDIPDTIKVIASDVDGVQRFYHHHWLNRTVEAALTEVAEQRPTYLVANMYGANEKYLHEQFKRVPLKGIITPSIVALPGMKPKTARKPHPDMLQYVMDVEGIEPSELLMFGDQLSADIEAAARIGVESALLPRRGSLDHLGVRVFRRGPEAMARVALNMPFRGKNFPSKLTSLDDWRKQNSGLYVSDEQTAE